MQNQINRINKKRWKMIEQKISIPMGVRFNRLLVVGEAEKSIQPNGKRKIRVTCLCDCGNTKIVHLANLKTNKSKSCGCLRREILLNANLTHGSTESKEYRAWESMKDRCTNPNCPKYKYYGGRGIKICETWLNSFESFLKDVGNAPGNDFSIDRIDNEKNYTPDNVRWADKKQQANNT
jgi:hypothetical protein